MPDSSFGIQTKNLIDANNLAFVHGGQQSDPTYGTVQNLLNPNWGVQQYDSGQAAAEDAAARGISGSNLANFRGARQYASDISRNALTANTLLSGATSRLPTPYDPTHLITTPFQEQTLGFDRQKLAQDAALERERQIAETNRAMIAANAHGGSGGGAGRGGHVSGGGADPYTGAGYRKGMYTGGDANPLKGGNSDIGHFGIPLGGVPYESGPNQVQFDWGTGQNTVQGGSVYDSNTPDYGLAPQGPLSGGYDWGGSGGGGTDSFMNQDLFGATGGGGDLSWIDNILDPGSGAG